MYFEKQHPLWPQVVMTLLLKLVHRHKLSFTLMINLNDVLKLIADLKSDFIAYQSQFSLNVELHIFC